MLKARIIPSQPDQDPSGLTQTQGGLAAEIEPGAVKINQTNTENESHQDQQGPVEMKKKSSVKAHAPPLSQKEFLDNTS